MNFIASVSSIFSFQFGFRCTFCLYSCALRMYRHRCGIPSTFESCHIKYVRAFFMLLLLLPQMFFSCRFRFLSSLFASSQHRTIEFMVSKSQRICLWESEFYTIIFTITKAMQCFVLENEFQLFVYLRMCFDAMKRWRRNKGQTCIECRPTMNVCLLKHYFLRLNPLLTLLSLHTFMALSVRHKR